MTHGSGTRKIFDAVVSGPGAAQVSAQRAPKLPTLRSHRISLARHFAGGCSTDPAQPGDGIDHKGRSGWFRLKRAD